VTREIRYLSDLHSADAAERLARISMGLIHGRLVLEQDGRRMHCHPGQVVRFSLRAEEGSNTGNLVLELMWRRPLEIAVVSDEAPARRNGQNGARRARPKKEEASGNG
jgi:hypothetical protein